MPLPAVVVVGGGRVVVVGALLVAVGGLGVVVVVLEVVLVLNVVLVGLAVVLGTGSGPSHSKQYSLPMVRAMLQLTPAF
jgi:hypothetical protein